MRLIYTAMLVCACLFTATNALAKDITLVTDFGINGRHAYFFVALERGYYEDVGLNVSIVRGQGSADAIRRVAAGNAQIGFADAAALVLARGNDSLPVRLVSITYASPPQAIYALESSGITGPEDLKGKRVADTAFSAIPTLFGAYASAADIPKDSVSWLVADGASLPSILATKRADAIGQFIVGEPLLEEAVAPERLVRLAYRDVGLDYYGNGLITSERMLEEDPETVRKFVAATLRGMKAAFEDPDAAGVILNRYHRQVDSEIGSAETRLVAELATVEGRALGVIDPERIRETVEVISAAYQLKRQVSPDELFAPGFVTE